jgi:cystathionine beta-lyase/cystathionine gamma-synthase
MPLLNYYSQTKMAKGEQYGVKTAILHLAPFNLSGKNVCPKASKECAAFCLNTSGRGQMNSVQQARINKTNYFWTNRNAFLWDLSREIQQLKTRAARQGFKFACRLNGTSDLSWHRLKIDGNQSVIDLHPDVQFYDYTKVYNHLDHGIKNYHVTFSHSGTNDSECLKALAAGHNVAYVFKNKLPKKYLGRRVIDGDKHDLRFKDPRGVVVGLVAKGLAKKAAQGGFVNG